VVRRLVEQQDVGLAHEGAGEQRLALAPARRGGELRVGVEAEVLEHRLDAHLHLPGAGRLELVVQPVELPQCRVGGRRRHGVAGGVIARQQAADIAEPLGDHGVDRAAHPGGDVLLQARHGRAAGTHDVARIGRERAVEQLQEGALAGAVAAEEADALPALHGERGAVEDRRSPERDAHVPHAQQRHGRPVSPWW
jgi:hypothetical protein